MIRVNRTLAFSLVSLGMAAAVVYGQTVARGVSRVQTSPSTATVQQVMRGILFPSSNVIFAAQSDDPETIKKTPNPSAAVNPLESVYGGWEAVANAAIALSESARLLEIPRKCSNGNEAPIQSANWKQGLSQLRTAGGAAHDAALEKSQDKVLDASEKVTQACSSCHVTFRDTAPRCVG